MRNIIIFLTLILLSSPGCKPYSYFKTPNDLLNQDCTIYLMDGTEKKGKLSIQFETGRKVDNPIHLVTGNTEEKIPVYNIKYYQCGNEYYYPKIINLNTYEIPFKDNLYLKDVRNIVFVKRLNNADSKILFYELYESRVSSPDGIEQHDYFVSFRTDDRLTAWNIRSNKFFPNFEEKMSKILLDCPSLSNKIKQQTNGYYAPQMSVDVKKYQIIKRIVDEYNACN